MVPPLVNYTRGIPISTKAFFQGPAEQHMRRASAMELERELSLAIDTPIWYAY